MRRSSPREFLGGIDRSTRIPLRIYYLLSHAYSYIHTLSLLSLIIYHSLHPCRYSTQNLLGAYRKIQYSTPVRRATVASCKRGNCSRFSIFPPCIRQGGPRGSILSRTIAKIRINSACMLGHGISCSDTKTRRYTV